MRKTSIIVFMLTFFLLSINSYAGKYRDRKFVNDRHDKRTFMSGDYNPKVSLFKNYSTSLRKCYACECQSTTSEQYIR